MEHAESLDFLTCSDGNAKTHLFNLRHSNGAYREGARQTGRFKRKVGVTTNGNTGGSDRAGPHLLKALKAKVTST